MPEAFPSVGDFERRPLCGDFLVELGSGEHQWLLPFYGVTFGISELGQPAYGNCCLVTTWVGIAHDCFEFGWPARAPCIRSTANGAASNQHWAMVSLTQPDLTPATVAGSWSIPRKKMSPGFFPAAVREACAAGGHVDVMHTTALIPG